MKKRPDVKTLDEGGGSIKLIEDPDIAKRLKSHKKERV